MFVVGDKIVYPMHGAGTIVSIEEKEVLGVIKKYLIMKMPIGDIKISIPVDRTEDIGIRDVMSADQRDKLMNVFQEEGTEMPGNWNQRYRHNLELLKTGDAVEIARVVRDLMLLEEEKGLSTGEKRMLNSAKKMIVSELVLVDDQSVEEVENSIERAVLKREII